MPFNGSGAYSLPGSSYPAVASTLIESSKYNNNLSDIATALSTCIAKDGQTTVTANLPMATYRHTGVGNAAALTDYASADQVVDNTLTYGGASAAGTDTYAVSFTISPGVQQAGQRFQFLADVANTGACTFNPNSIGAKSIKLADGSDPHDGAIQANAAVDVIDDGTNYILLNPHLAIGTDVQAYDAALDDISGLAVTDGNIIVGDGANWVAESGATARSSLGLSIGSDVLGYVSGNWYSAAQNTGPAAVTGYTQIGAALYINDTGLSSQTSLTYNSLTAIPVPSGSSARALILQIYCNSYGSNGANSQRYSYTRVYSDASGTNAVCEVRSRAIEETASFDVLDIESPTVIAPVISGNVYVKFSARDGGGGGTSSYSILGYIY